MRGRSLRAGNALTPTQLRIGGGTRIRRPRRLRAGFAVIALLLDRLHGFARDCRGSASIELALGALVLISTSVLCFDLYSRIKADTAIARMAVTMADYVSRDADPDGEEMKALGDYLYDHELGGPANMVYVVTALHQPPGGDPRPNVVVLWSDDTIRIGDPTVTEDLAAGCAHFVADGGAADLPDGFTMADNEVLVIAEVCARLTREGFLTGEFVAGGIYRLHALPARDPDRQPAAPVYAERAGTYTTVATFAVGATRGAGAAEVSGQMARPSPAAAASA